MLNEKEFSEIIDAISNLNNKVEAVSMDLLLHKATHENRRSRNNHVVKELTDWGEWARRIIVALVTALATVLGKEAIFGVA